MRFDCLEKVQGWNYFIGSHDDGRLRVRFHVPKGVQHKGVGREVQEWVQWNGGYEIVFKINRFLISLKNWSNHHWIIGEQYNTINFSKWQMASHHEKFKQCLWFRFILFLLQSRNLINNKFVLIINWYK